MSDLLTELSQKARRLPPSEREQLVEEILASLSDQADADIDAAWDQEIRRRVDEVERGVATLVPAEEVFAEARRAIGR
jgi:putative addiction module component (TIGR02574 family)